MRRTNNITARVFKYARGQVSKNQRQFSKDLEISQSALSRLERGVHFPQDQVIRKLEEVTSLSMRQMIRRSRSSIY